MHPRRPTRGCLTCAVAAMVLWPSIPASGRGIGPESKTAEEDTVDTVGAHWSLLPIVFSSPDTRFGFGVLPQYLFYLAPDSRPSNLRVDAYYTMNRQYSVQLRPQLWLKSNSYRLAATAIFKEWPTDYYGIGRDARKDDEEGFTERFLNLVAEAQRQFRPGLFVGTRYTLRSSRITETEPGRVLERGLIPGSRRGLASGLGLLVSWDTRDNVYFPSSGSYHQVSADFSGGLLGSDYRFDVYTLDLRRYFPIAAGQVLAVEAATTITAGTPPFRVLPGVGDVLRGYASTRYIDKNRMVVQVEYRFVPIWWRIGLTVFGGISDVADRIDAFSLREPIWAVGAGLRFLLVREEKITIRLDFGIGKNASGYYLDLNEAF